MTYSMIGRCPESGAFGGVVGTSALGVGNRCLKVCHGRGAFLSQHRTDTRLAELGIAYLAEGVNAQDAMDKVVNGARNIDWRQLAALDGGGGTATFHGKKMYSIYTGSEGQDCVAIGNILANHRVTDAMVAAFEASRGAALAERLLQGLEAGRDAGGEILEPIRSAALFVSGEEGIAQYDLRVDSSPEAAAGLRALFTEYGEQHALIRAVALTPEDIPVSRTLFEASIERIGELGLESRFPTEKNRDAWQLRD